MIGVVSDVHMHNFRPFGGVKVSGINERCHMTLVSLSDAVAYLNEHDATDLVITGDLYDVSDPPPQVITATLEVLHQFLGNVHIIPGNHDQFSLSEGDHALGPMHEHGRIHVVGMASSIMEEMCAIPFNPEPTREWLPDTLKQLRHTGHLGVVFAHFGIIDEDTESFLRESPDAIEADTLFGLMEKYDVDTFVVGNWHEHHRWRLGKRQIIQVGALVPTGFNNLGKRYGRLVLIESPQVIATTQIAGPRFVKMTWGQRPKLKGYGESVYVHMEAQPGDLKAAREWLRSEQAQKLGIAGFQIVPNKERAQQQARAAARATSKVDMVKSASAQFVQKMPLEEGVSRERVLSHVQRYLAGRR